MSNDSIKPTFEETLKNHIDNEIGVIKEKFIKSGEEWKPLYEVLLRQGANLAVIHVGLSLIQTHQDLNQ